MRAVFLGAGASVPAGYPLATSLLAEADAAAASSRFPQFSEAWRKWQKYINEAPPLVRLILHNNNPEIVLSFPDLADFAAESEDDFKMRTAVAAFKTKEEHDASELEAYYSSPEREFSSEARIAKARLMNALQWFFTSCIRDMQSARTARDYLRMLLEGLKVATPS
jgi:hypothetical protein